MSLNEVFEKLYVIYMQYDEVFYVSWEIGVFVVTETPLILFN